MTPAQAAIIEWLTMLRNCSRGNGIPSGYTYAGIGDFLLCHAQSYEPRPLPARFSSGFPSACFYNASRLARRRRGYRYVEGYAAADIGGSAFPTHHAWNLDREGKLIDTTWKDIGLAYFGVVLPAPTPGRSVLDDPYSRFIIFKEPWKS